MPTIKETIPHFSSKLFNNFSTSNPIDILWEEFESLCSRCMSFIPTKTSRNSHTKLWIFSFIRRRKQHLYNVVKRSNCTLKWQAYKNIKKKYIYNKKAAQLTRNTSFSILILLMPYSVQHISSCALCDESSSVTKQLCGRTYNSNARTIVE